MSVIVRLRGLPSSAGSVDIRHYFAGLSIPDGCVHIVGGKEGDAFITFTTDEDARIALRMDTNSKLLNRSKIELMFSSSKEMKECIANATQPSGFSREPCEKFRKHPAKLSASTNDSFSDDLQKLSPKSAKAEVTFLSEVEKLLEKLESGPTQSFSDRELNKLKENSSHSGSSRRLQNRHRQRSVEHSYLQEHMKDGTRYESIAENLLQKLEYGPTQSFLDRELNKLNENSSYSGSSRRLQNLHRQKNVKHSHLQKHERDETEYESIISKAHTQHSSTRSSRQSLQKATHQTASSRHQNEKILSKLPDMLANSEPAMSLKGTLGGVIQSRLSKKEIEKCVLICGLPLKFDNSMAKDFVTNIDGYVPGSCFVETDEMGNCLGRAFFEFINEAKAVLAIQSQVFFPFEATNITDLEMRNFIRKHQNNLHKVNSIRKKLLTSRDEKSAQNDKKFSAVSNMEKGKTGSRDDLMASKLKLLSHSFLGQDSLSNNKRQHFSKSSASKTSKLGSVRNIVSGVTMKDSHSYLNMKKPTRTVSIVSFSSQSPKSFTKVEPTLISPHSVMSPKVNVSVNTTVGKNKQQRSSKKRLMKKQYESNQFSSPSSNISHQTSNQCRTNDKTVLSSVKQIGGRSQKNSMTKIQNDSEMHKLNSETLRNLAKQHAVDVPSPHFIPSPTENKSNAFASFVQRNCGFGNVFTKPSHISCRFCKSYSNPTDLKMNPFPTASEYSRTFSSLIDQMENDPNQTLQLKLFRKTPTSSANQISNSMVGSLSSQNSVKALIKTEPHSSTKSNNDVREKALNALSFIDELMAEPQSGSAVAGGSSAKIPVDVPDLISLRPSPPRASSSRTKKFFMDLTDNQLNGKKSEKVAEQGTSQKAHTHNKLGRDRSPIRSSADRFKTHGSHGWSRSPHTRRHRSPSDSHVRGKSSRHSWTKNSLSPRRRR